MLVNPPVGLGVYVTELSTSSTVGHLDMCMWASVGGGFANEIITVNIAIWLL